LIRGIASGSKTIRLITLSEYLEEYPVHQVSSPCISSWGDRGFNEVWLNGSNDWIYPQLHRAASLLQDMATRCFRADGLKRRALNQAARELLLAQASDWAFMINSGTTSDYARKRTEDHISHLHRIFRELETQQIDEAWLSTLESRDNIFPRIQFESFAREPAPSARGLVR
jgi:1,4-alpha-glucan branching enzyme